MISTVGGMKNNSRTVKHPRFVDLALVYSTILVIVLHSDPSVDKINEAGACEISAHCLPPCYVFSRLNYCF